MSKAASDSVYVVALRDATEAWSTVSWFDIVDKQHVYFHPVGRMNFPKDPVTQLGFRYRGQLHSVRRVASVTTISCRSELSKHIAAIDGEACRIAYDGGQRVPHFLYRLGPAELPSKLIRSGSIRARHLRIDRDLLLSSTTVEEAYKLTRERSLTKLQLLEPLMERAELDEAYARARHRLMEGAVPIHRRVSARGGSVEGEVFWREEEGFWCYFDTDVSEGCRRIQIGREDPTKVAGVSIDVEINSPFEGLNQRLGGVFARDDDGTTYLAHTGGIGGGRKGIGKSAFLNSMHAGVLREMRTSSGSLLIRIIAPIDSDQLPSCLAKFVDDVVVFKEEATSGYPLSAAGRKPMQSDFVPEFSGKRATYELSGTIASECYHGAVVSKLHKLLGTWGVEAANDKVRDLFVCNAHGEVTHLFEVKSAATTQDLYTAVGQLMVHGATVEQAPLRILVVPDILTPSTATAVARLSIVVVTYEWQGSVLRFDGLTAALFDRQSERTLKA